MHETIFVSIASYRDVDCKYTLSNLYKNAKFPERVYVGIVQQNNIYIKEDNDNEECVKEDNEIIKKYNKNIRVLTLEHMESKGANHTRFLCSRMHKGETYFFQIDSHIRFIMYWDEKIINMFKQLEDQGIEKPLLSHYTRDKGDYVEYDYTKIAIDNYNKKEDKNDYDEVPRICKSFFNDDNMISFLGAENVKRGELYETPFIAGGFLFARSSFLKDVPYNPDLEYLWIGEEWMISARAYTNGYRIFSPSSNLIFHEYTRPKAKKIWGDKTYSDRESIDKVRYLLKLVNDDSNIKEKIKSRYGLGNKKTLDEFYEFAGVDLKNRIITKNFCKVNNISDDIVIPENVSIWNKYKQYLIPVLIINIIILLILVYYNKVIINYFKKIK